MELAKRMGFYHSCQALGSMMSGALQAAIMDTLDGHTGLAGWRYELRDPIETANKIFLTDEISAGCSSLTP